VYANFPICVYYDVAASKWAIFSQAGAPGSMPVDASFKVRSMNAIPMKTIPNGWQDKKIKFRHIQGD
jgi:hypothetical protein